MKPRSLSELECFVLGLIWQTGPCSAYDVRRRMLDSPSTQWSASAGAIYPLARKLEGLRLLSSRAEATGKRGRRVYKATAAGERAVRAWLGPPLGREAITVAYDPLRSRARFLGLLPVRERAAWVQAALAALDEVESRVRRWEQTHHGRNASPVGRRGAAGSQDPFLALVTRNGEMDVAMRRAWVREVGKAVGK